MVLSQEEALKKLLDAGHISEDICRRLASYASPVGTDIGALESATIDVLILLIDKSKSIANRGLTEAVIQAQHAAIEAFSAADSKKSIKLGQMLFDHETHELQRIMDFRDKGKKIPKQEIMRLDNSNYVPDGGTALRDTVLRAIAALAPCMITGLEDGFVFINRILILTDGLDEHSKAQPHEVAEIVKCARLIQPSLLSYIGLLGIGDADYTTAGVDIGIDPTRIMSCQATAQAIRAGMYLMSSNAISDL